MVIWRIVTPEFQFFYLPVKSEMTANIIIVGEGPNNIIVGEGIKITIPGFAVHVD